MYKLENYTNEGALKSGATVISSGGGADNFLELTDTPDSYITYSGKVVRVKGDESGLEFGVASSVGTFLDLTDTPSSYAGQASKTVIVKTDETGLEFGAGAGSDAGARKLALVGW